jgi:hypothetical protein
LGHLGHGQFEATYQHDTRCRGWLYLSLVALLILWIGTPWPYQFLMTIPFIFVAFIIRRSGKTALSMLAGILPIALLFLLFQDADHSRLYPILLVIAWVLSIVLGHYLGGGVFGYLNNQRRNASLPWAACRYVLNCRQPDQGHLPPRAAWLTCWKAGAASGDRGTG